MWKRLKKQILIIKLFYGIIEKFLFVTGFQQSCTLKDHLRTHSGEAPFLCSECGKAFNNSSNLRQHLVRHSGLKPFACSQCPSRFASKGNVIKYEICVI